MRHGCKWTIFALCLLALVGCRSDGRVLPPAGTAQHQRFNATVFDPYTDNDIAPEVVGGRPKDFQKPLSDADRSRLFRKYWTPY